MNDSKVAFLVPAWKPKKKIGTKLSDPKLLIKCMHTGLIKRILAKASKGVNMQRCQKCVTTSNQSRTSDITWFLHMTAEYSVHIPAILPKQVSSLSQQQCRPKQPSTFSPTDTLQLLLDALGIVREMWGPWGYVDRRFNWCVIINTGAVASVEDDVAKKLQKPGTRAASSATPAAANRDDVDLLKRSTFVV